MKGMRFLGRCVQILGAMTVIAIWAGVARTDMFYTGVLCLLIWLVGDRLPQE